MELGRFIPDSLKNHFPKRAQALDGYIDLLKTGNSTSIQALALMEEEVAMTSFIGNLGTLTFIMELRALNERGRPLLFKEVLALRSRVLSGFIDRRVVMEDGARSYLTIVKKLLYVHKKMPGVHSSLITPQGILNDKDYTYFVEYSTERGVQPWP